MHVDVVTLFPELFEAHLKTSLLGKAVAGGIVTVALHDPREKGLGKHRSVDDLPYGGGAGMLMRPEPIFETVEPLLREDSHVILLSPRGTRLVHSEVERLATKEHLILICGRYEGVDERVALHLADEELSLGDFVLSGGEVAAIAIIEATSRLIPGVLGNSRSLDSESHASGTLEHPQYTRPEDYRGMVVPPVLLSGDHGEVERWRRERSDDLTRSRRPDLAPDPGG
jgi:tRNA (guanine37-N1)-methyltransferase